jgi:RES domain-containing protein
MLVYRLCKTEYAEDLKGTGAKLFGGRWNQIDTACIYTSESRALAVLEYSVNVSINFIPRALSMCVFEIDDELIKSFRISQLPGNWLDVPAPYSTKVFGSKWLNKGTAVLKLPSTVIPEEYNYIINPMFDAEHFKLISVKDFVYDLRVKNV